MSLNEKEGIGNLFASYAHGRLPQNAEEVPTALKSMIGDNLDAEIMYSLYTLFRDKGEDHFTAYQHTLEDYIKAKETHHADS